MIDNGLPPGEFLPADIYPSRNFPGKATYTSQWSTEFIDYVDDLENHGLLTQE